LTLRCWAACKGIMLHATLDADLGSPSGHRLKVSKHWQGCRKVPSCAAYVSPGMRMRERLMHAGQLLPGESAAHLTGPSRRDTSSAGAPASRSHTWKPEV
jgi:hypothetical protein